MNQPVQVLLIEDNRLFVELTRRMLDEAKTTEFAIECVDNLAAGMERLSIGGIDAVLLDLTLPDSTGLDTFLQVHEAAPSVPTIIYTSLDDEELSLSALNYGAADYLVKSEVNANWLVRSLVFAIQRNRVSQATERAANLDASAGKEAVTLERSSEAETRWVATLTDKRLVSIPVLDQMKDRLLNLLRRADAAEILMDFSQVEYVANAAISMLLIVHKRCRAADKRFVLCNLKGQVYEQLSSRRFDRVFDIQRAQP